MTNSVVRQVDLDHVAPTYFMYASLSPGTVYNYVYHNTGTPIGHAATYATSGLDVRLFFLRVMRGSRASPRFGSPPL